MCTVVFVGVEGAESTNHVFFGCLIARFSWCCLRDAFGWAGCPSSLSDALGDHVWGGKIPIRLKFFIIAGVTWAIWRSRNRMAIEKTVPQKPLGCNSFGCCLCAEMAAVAGSFWSSKHRDPGREDEDVVPKPLSEQWEYFGHCGTMSTTCCVVVFSVSCATC